MTTATRKIDLTATSCEHSIIEVWRYRGTGRRLDRRATIQVYSNGDGTFTVKDGRPYGHMSGADRVKRVGSIQAARAAFRMVRNTLEREGYTKVGLAGD